MENKSITKLKSLARFLKISGRFFFENFNLYLFTEFIFNDPEISIIINNLLDKFSSSTEKAKTALEKAGEVGNLRKRMTSFEEWVAFCVAYIKGTRPNKGNVVIDNFITYTGQARLEEKQELIKAQFFNECIEPILIYIELQVKQELNAIYILQRYKILCEWYEREQLFDKKELDITQNHLSKYLFNQGFTYSLSEINVPSGKIDNLAIDIGLKDRTEFGTLPNAIVAEAKIFKGDKRKIIDVKNQVLKRMQNLNFSEGFCVIFNKSNKKISFSINTRVSGFTYIVEDSRKIFFIIINLHNLFYQSASSIEEIIIDLK